MKKLFTVDDFIVAFISATGWANHFQQSRAGQRGKQVLDFCRVHSRIHGG